jgi:hypothetical protein
MNANEREFVPVGSTRQRTSPEVCRSDKDWPKASLPGVSGTGRSHALQRWDDPAPSGVGRDQAFENAGGVAEGSRGLSQSASDTPTSRDEMEGIPEGCQKLKCHALWHPLRGAFPSPRSTGGLRCASTSGYPLERLRRCSFRARGKMHALQPWASPAATMAAALQAARGSPETRMPSSDFFRVFREGGLFSAANTLNFDQSSAALALWRRVAVPGSLLIPGSPEDGLEPHRGEKCPRACEKWRDWRQRRVEAAEARAYGRVAWGLA